MEHVFTGVWLLSDGSPFHVVLPALMFSSWSNWTIGISYMSFRLCFPWGSLRAWSNLWIVTGVWRCSGNLSKQSPIRTGAGLCVLGYDTIVFIFPCQGPAQPWHIHTATTLSTVYFLHSLNGHLVTSNKITGVITFNRAEVRSERWKRLCGYAGVYRYKDVSEITYLAKCCV